LSTEEPSHASGDLFLCGSTEVSYLLSDAFGNTSFCEFNIVVECTTDGCCRSETDFQDNTNKDMTLSAQFDSQGNCNMDYTLPALSECQFATSIVWGDGTISTGMWANLNVLKHNYTNSGDYSICVDFQEFGDDNVCHQNQKCIDINIGSECTIKKSINSSNLDKLVIISPNPTSGLININIDHAEFNETLVSMNVYDISGTLLLSQSAPTKDITQTMDLSDFGASLYLLRIEFSNGIYITKKILLL